MSTIELILLNVGKISLTRRNFPYWQTKKKQFGTKSERKLLLFRMITILKKFINPMFSFLTIFDLLELA